MHQHVKNNSIVYRKFKTVKMLYFIYRNQFRNYIKIESKFKNIEFPNTFTTYFNLIHI